jgi:hypothetical protein
MTLKNINSLDIIIERWASGRFTVLLYVDCAKKRMKKKIDILSNL